MAKAAHGFAVIALALIAGLFVAPAARAQSCATLARQLAGLGSGGGGGGGAWSDAAQRQAAAIRQVEAEMRAANCGGFFGSGYCSGLGQRLGEMRANLARLQSGGAARGDTGAMRARIQAQMAALGCNGEVARAPVPPAPIAAQPPKPATYAMPAANPGERMFVANGPGGVPYLYREDASGRIAMLRPVGGGPVKRAVAVQPQSQPGYSSGSLFGSLFGATPPGVRETYGDQNAVDQPAAPPGQPSLGGGMRTLCVRTCDGFYFPITNAAGEGRFEKDAETCRSLCPAAETRLFYHSNSNPDADEIFSADAKREPYARMSYAFKYREGMVPQCGCGRPAPGMTPLDGSGAGGVGFVGDPDAQLRPTIASPGVRVPPEEDPETQANMAGNFTPLPVTAAPAPVADAATPGGKKVRIVGPSYYIAR